MSKTEELAAAIRANHTGHPNEPTANKRDAQWYDPKTVDPDAWGKGVAMDESGLPVANVPTIKTTDYFDYAEPAQEGFITKDSGQRDVFESGCQRDLATGKGAYDLVSPEAMLRLAQLYERGGQKYEEFNWTKGMPFRRVIQSMLRHAFQYLACDNSEDHLAGVTWNAFTLMAYEEAIKNGCLPAKLDNRFRWKKAAS